jgi:ligand-binding sensor domain-containing protein
LLWLLTTAPALAQTQATDTVLQAVFHFQHLNSDDGLVQNSIETLLQDQQGHLWFGTTSGLSRFDGYRFTTYQAQQGNPTSACPPTGCATCT